MRFQKLDRILSAEGELQPLIAKARDLRALAGLVQGFFPPDLARQARVANYREGELVLVAPTSAAGAKLRLLAPTLSRFLSERRWQVNSVSIRVQPNRSRSVDVAPQKSATLSTPTLNSLRALHDRMRPSPARDALRRLLQRRSLARISHGKNETSGRESKKCLGRDT